MYARSLRVLFFCSGTGLYNRGVESLFRESFDGLWRRMLAFDIDVHFCAGGANDGAANGRERRLWCLPRTSLRAHLLSGMIRREPYVIEQLTFLPALSRFIARHRPHLLYYSDVNISMRLESRPARHTIGYKLLFNNGGPSLPPFTGVDHVHQVAPLYLEQAMRAGEPKAKHTLLPQGIAVPDGAPLGADPAARLAARRELGLPTDRVIVISVGAIGTKTHKRMPYTVDEVARLPKDRRPFLLLLGALEEGTEQLRQTMIQELGHDGFAIRSVPYEQVRRHYQAADCFVLGSLKEGFGRVYLEALIEGLPCIVHDGPVMRYVLGDQGTYADLSQDGAMATALADTLNRPNTPEDAVRRREAVRQRFSWQTLAPAYADMFKRAAGVLPP